MMVSAEAKGGITGIREVKRNREEGFQSVMPAGIGSVKGNQTLA